MLITSLTLQSRRKKKKKKGLKPGKALNLETIEIGCVWNCAFGSESQAKFDL